ncbi:hypothetical protein [Marinobacterium arenosum]|uniref:hypothetical protein n=1 Tax=Marinobacterium arenosum TaxID=2862496 RepID=UPI001C94FB9C|nr:hypothetical protein [Marinobacterium arenosum]MBY4677087.1 hypothetical protein [Marinobacterium arenosum]
MTLSLDDNDAAAEAIDYQVERQLDELYGDAVAGDRMLRKFMSRVSKNFSGAASIKTAPLKARATAKAKLTRQFPRKEVEQLKDIARATLEFKSFEDMYAARDYIRDQPEFQSFTAAAQRGALKNRYRPAIRGGMGPTDQGYRDIKFFLWMDIGGGRGHIVELQLNVTRTLKAKSIGHPFYDIIRIGGDLWDPAAPNSDLLVPRETVKKVGPKLVHACNECIRREIQAAAARKVLELVKNNFYVARTVTNSRGEQYVRRYELKDRSVMLRFNNPAQIEAGRALLTCSSAAYRHYKALGLKYRFTGRPDEVWGRV